MSALDKARANWGDRLPDWLEVLAGECDRSSQHKAAKQLGYSAATVSLVLNGTYKGGLTAVEQAVRGILMKAVVECPVVGELAVDQCMRHQKTPWSPHNPQRLVFYRACRNGCTHSRLRGSDDR